jgi:hypothetical protein
VLEDIELLIDELFKSLPVYQADQMALAAQHEGAEPADLHLGVGDVGAGL